jgi:uncharacterized membrane protein YgcG
LHKFGILCGSLVRSRISGIFADKREKLIKWLYYEKFYIRYLNTIVTMNGKTIALMLILSSTILAAGLLIVPDTIQNALAQSSSATTGSSTTTNEGASAGSSSVSFSFEGGGATDANSAAAAGGTHVNANNGEVDSSNDR